MIYPFLTSGERIANPPVTRIQSADFCVPQTHHDNIINVLTLNVAHGRKDAFHQIFVRKKKLQKNLDEIASIIRREDVHLVALQEADGPSLWSGNFNHVEHLSFRSNIPNFIQGEHVAGNGLRYGTAILSKFLLHKTLSVTFKPTPPTPTKGFVLTTFSLPWNENIQIDVVSAHLDFARRSVQLSQVKEIITTLQNRYNPLIIMGDLNCEWAVKNSPVRMLASKLKLQTYEPESSTISTFPLLQKRTDWILTSPEFTILEHNILSDTVSDHRAVSCKIRLSEI